jgi:rsbT co-antagonist protein RsbR
MSIALQRGSRTLRCYNSRIRKPLKSGSTLADAYFEGQAFTQRGVLLSMTTTDLLASVLRKRSDALLAEWMNTQAAGLDGSARSRMTREELERECRQFLQLLSKSVQGGKLAEANTPETQALLRYLEELSRTRATQGFSSSETASFIFSFKQPLFVALRSASGKDADGLADEIWAATEILDALGLHTVATFQKAREQLINRQQRDLLELSTPVVSLWQGILALPMIGTLDSARTQIVMESLLQKIVETGSQIAIIDITGVPTVDTQVAQHLIKTVTALRLMGAECIISGIRPQIAQTIVHLGVDLQGVTTKANLADALAVALKRTGHSLNG